MTAAKNTTIAPPTAQRPDISSWKTAGRNVRFQTLDGLLFIAVDISDGAYKGVSITEKGNATIASTLGNIAVSDTLKLGLNIYGRPPVAAVAA